MKKHNTQITAGNPDQLISFIVSEASKERPESPLENASHFESRLKAQLKESLKQFQQRLQSAIQHLDNQKLLPKDDRYQAVEKLLHDHRMQNELEQGKTMQELFHFTNEELSSFYTAGLELFHQSHYDTASNIFLFLTQLNPLVSSFWSCLAIAEEKRGEIKDAMHAYLIAAGLSEKTLTPYMDAARCLIRLNQTEDAKKALELASQRAETEEQLKPFKDEIIKFKNQIKSLLI